MSDNLFSTLEGLCQTLVPVVLQSGTRLPNPRFNPMDPASPPWITTPTTGTRPIRFLIHAITANQLNEADAQITEVAKPIYQTQPSPGGRGTVEALVDYGYSDPEYIARRLKQMPLRNAAICLFGCPALRESTPGAGQNEQISHLISKIPAAVLEWLAKEIDDMSIITAVGEEMVRDFLSGGAGNTDTQGSSGTSTPPPPRKKKKSPPSRTGTTSKTNNAAPPTSGE